MIQKQTSGGRPPQRQNIQEGLPVQRPTRARRRPSTVAPDTARSQPAQTAPSVCPDVYVGPENSASNQRLRAPRAAWGHAHTPSQERREEKRRRGRGGGPEGGGARWRPLPPELNALRTEKMKDEAAAGGPELRLMLRIHAGGCGTLALASAGPGRRGELLQEQRLGCC